MGRRVGSCVGQVLHLARCAAVAAAAALICGCVPVTPRPDIAAGFSSLNDPVQSADLSPVAPSGRGNADTGKPSGLAAFLQFGDANVERVTGAPLPTVEPGPGGGYSLNFESAPVAAVAKAVLGDILGVGYAIDPRAQGTISLSSGRPVSRKEVLFVLESALRTVNLALVRDGAGYRITPSSEAPGSGGLDTAASGTEPGYGITAIPLRYISVQTVTKLLDGFAAKAGAIRADPTGNMILVAGSGVERRAVAETVQSFDADWMRGQSVGVFPLHNSAPEAMIAELEKITDSGEGGLGQNAVKYQPIARLNAILVVARKPGLLQAAAGWIQRLDKSEAAALGIKVYHVRYGEARVLARLLNEIFGGATSSAIDTPAGQLAPASGSRTLSAVDRLTGVSAQPGGSASSFRSAAPPTSQDSGAGPAASGFLAAGSPSAGSPSGPSIFPGTRITADPVNNTILIYAQRDAYRTIETALAQLDRPQLQVAIQLTIAEVTLNDKLNYGVQFFLKSSDLGLGRDKGSFVNTSLSSILSQQLPGGNLLIGSQMQPRLIIDALHAFTDVKVLSNPSLVVLDNQTATLQVGDQVPITTGQATVLSANNTVVSTVDYRNTGIILQVQPRINSNGNVTLDVDQEISNVAANSNPDTLTPTLSRRRVKSSIQVAGGQTVLLAGLISDTRDRGRSGLPFVDQIPVLGDVFTQTKRENARTELIIFIQPQIIRDSVDASYVAEGLRKKLTIPQAQSTYGVPYIGR